MSDLNDTLTSKDLFATPLSDGADALFGPITRGARATGRKVVEDQRVEESTDTSDDNSSKSDVPGNAGQGKGLGLGRVVDDVTDVARGPLKVGLGRKFGRGSDGDDEIVIENAAGAIAFGGKGNDKLVGGIGGDKLIGKWGSNNLDGGEGADTLRGGDGNDTVMGGLGSDRGVGGDGDDWLNGGAGADILRGDLGRDTLLGGADNDRLFGFEDADSIEGGDGDDIVRGGLADDLLYGGQGRDIVRGGEDNDSIWGGDDADRLFGGNGDDSVLGEAGDDRLEGQGGNDTLDGGDGADNLRGGSDNDLIFGGLGNDYVLAGTGDDRAEGDAGDDALHGQAGADTLDGGDGDDRVFGGNGDDVLNGGAGNDIINGGANNDVLTGDDGNDTMGGSNGTDVLFGGLGSDELNGGAGDDSLDGGAGDDALDGGANADTLAAGDGDDSLLGGAGNDALFGGAGHDVMLSDAGDDTMTGGEGMEWYYYEGTDFGHDLITDFDTAGGDLLDLSRTGLTRADLDVRQVSDDMITIDAPGANSITLAGISEFDINSTALYFGDDDKAVTTKDFIANGSFENVTETGDVLAAFNGNGNGRHDTSEVVWYRSVEGWSSNDGRVEVKGEDASGAFAIDAADGDFYIELDDGSSRSQFENNEIHQDVAGLTEGRSYELSFDFANNAGHSHGHVDVFFGGEKVASITSNSGRFATKSFDVTGGAGDGSDRLSFVTQNTGNEAGAYIDNVKLIGLVETSEAPSAPVADETPADETPTDDAPAAEAPASETSEVAVDAAFSYATGGNLGMASGSGPLHRANVDFSKTSDLKLIVQNDDDPSVLDAGETIGFSFTSATGNHIVVEEAVIGQSAFADGADTGVLTATGTIVGGHADGVEVALLVNFNADSIPAGQFFYANDDNADANAGFESSVSLSALPANDDAEPAFDGELLTGTDGRDTLRGNGLDDVLEGGGDRDRLFGGDGDDTLNGGAGNDVMKGGDGADVFLFEDFAFGDDRIRDFNAGEGDLIDFSQIADELAALEITRSGRDTIIKVDNGGTVELDNVLPDEFSPSEVFLFG